MRVKVIKPIDSASYGRIIQKGEVVDLPIEGDSVLITKGFVEETNESLTEQPERPAVTGRSRTVLLTEADEE